MANFMVPPHGSCMIKCKHCKGLYMPDKIKNSFYEKCPFCGEQFNTYKQTIPVWMYNLIKFFRSGQHCEDIENGMTKFEFEKPKSNEARQVKCVARETTETPPIEFFDSEKVVPKLKKKKFTEVFDTKPARPQAPKVSDFWYTITVEFDKNKETYRFYGIVDSLADLPYSGDMPINAAYYVEAKQKFVTPSGKLWDLENDLEKRFVGRKRKQFLEEARKEYKLGFDITKPLFGDPRILMQ